MRIFFLAIMIIVLGAAWKISDAHAADRRCTTWGADHHVPGYRAPSGAWIPARTIPGPCTRWEYTKDKRDARTDEFMDRQNRLERERADRERRQR